MLCVYDQIQQLRAELRDCALTPTERQDAANTLTQLEAAQAELDRAFAEDFIGADAPPD